MSGKAAKIRLTEKQHAILQQIVRSTTASQRLVQRARLIVLAFGGMFNRVIANTIALHRKQVGLWRRRWQQSFDALVPLHYDEADRRAGYITAANRTGQVRNFPLMTLSACIATNEAEDVTHPGQISKTLAELKSVAKRAARSTCVRDRRGKYPKSSAPGERDSAPGRRTSGGDRGEADAAAAADEADREV